MRSAHAKAPQSRLCTRASLCLASSLPASTTLRVDWPCICAGYGRKQAAELLVGKGARIDVRNSDKQTPAGVAQLNRELHMVTYLAERSEAEGGSKFL